VESINLEASAERLLERCAAIAERITRMAHVLPEPP
jgi:hypothetical protein